MLVELQKGDNLAFFLMLVPSLSFSCPTASWPLAAHIFPMPLHLIRKKKYTRLFAAQQKINAFQRNNV